MSILISKLSIGGANPGDFFVVNTVNPPGTFRATVASVKAATGTRPAGSVNPTKIAPGTNISQLPLLANVYNDDLIMVDQGTPPITRLATVLMVNTWTGSAGLNSELTTVNQSIKISGLPPASSAFGDDYVLVNQGNPPKTRRTQLANGLPILTSDSLLLAHFDGNFVDSSRYNRTPVLIASPTISATTKLFGTGALSVDTSNTQEVDYGGFSFASTDDFTIEGFCYMTDTTNGQVLWRFDMPSPFFYGAMSHTFDGFFPSWNVQGVAFGSPQRYTTNQWIYTALTRTNGQLRGYSGLAGGTAVLDGSAGSASGINNLAFRMAWGGVAVGINLKGGFLDEWRIKRVSLYGAASSFPVPTSAFPS